MDIGGGSTELVLAGLDGYVNLDSLKLGCVRLTNRFLARKADQVPTSVFDEMCQYVRIKGIQALKRANMLTSSELIASSGTAIALHNIAFRLEHGTNPNDEQTTLTLEALKKTSEYICGLTANQRRALPGISAKRAQVLVAGAAILQTLMEELKFDKLTISNRNLQDGILMDYLHRNKQRTLHNERSVREQSIVQLAQRCQFEERHSRHIANLTLQMHDSAVDCGLIPLDHQGRELLYYSTILHDIGIFIAYTQHAGHGAYLIKNTELLGFTEDEIRFMADIVQYHNVKPTKKYEEFIRDAINDANKQRVFALIISLAENMDRLHCQHVREASFTREDDVLSLKVSSLSKSPIEIDGVTSMAKLISKCFKEEVIVKFTSLG